MTLAKNGPQGTPPMKPRATGLRAGLKAVSGGAVGALWPQCRYRKAIFLLGHMRVGSTALSNVFCSRRDVSGYGEAHIRYSTQGALGRLVINQARRGAWKPGARHLFDKVLHSRHDNGACTGFFTAQAVFMARAPGPAIASIRKLYDGLGRSEYQNDALAAQYYVARMTDLLALWARFPAGRRTGLTHAMLMQDPETQLARLSHRLALSPPLENSYESLPASRKGGGGDPTASGKLTRVEPRPDKDAEDKLASLAIEMPLRVAASDVYARFEETVANH